ncbi:MAG: SRPBCC family protein [Cyanobacteria bacterium J06635_15]
MLSLDKPRVENFQPHSMTQATQQVALLRGDILVGTNTYRPGGGAVTAQMYLPLARSQAWGQLTDYSRWVQFFPDVIQSKVLEAGSSGDQGKRLYQLARKTFLMLTAQAEIYLRVFEKLHQQIQFRFERGAFSDFAADLTLQDYHNGTLLTYSVQATPLIPVPGFLIEQVLRQDLPGNMARMRKVLCSKA